MADAAIDVRVHDLPVRPITRETFAPFGDLIEPTDDGAALGKDASLDLSRGSPRLYIMRLKHRGLEFRRITRHRNVTQCLAALGDKSWLLAVAPPKSPDDPLAQPDLAEIRAFSISGSVAIKLHRGTWHAGPFFEDEEISFINLELSGTNDTDHHDSHLDQRYGVALRFVAHTSR